MRISGEPREEFINQSKCLISKMKHEGNLSKKPLSSIINEISKTFFS